MRSRARRTSPAARAMLLAGVLWSAVPDAKSAAGAAPDPAPAADPFPKARPGRSGSALDPARAGPPQGTDAPADDSFDAARYPERDLPQLLEKNPCKRGPEYELKDIMFSGRLTYKEAQRDTPPKDRELVRRWTASLEAADQAALFTRELLVEDGKKNSWWMPVPKTLTPYLRQDLRVGDSAVFYMSFVGCVDGRPMFGIEEYSVPEYEDLENDAATYVT